MMALLERVGLLLRANLNELMDRAEDPVKTLNQVILDIANQLMQVKTQVAIAVADRHLLEARRAESAEREGEWMRRAEAALKRGDEEMARVALERALPCRELGRGLGEQLEDQKVQVENLRAAFGKLESKLAETRGQAELLKAQYRRARVEERARGAGEGDAGGGVDRALGRMLSLAGRETAVGGSAAVEERFVEVERNEAVEKLLAELKGRT